MTIRLGAERGDKFPTEPGAAQAKLAEFGMAFVGGASRADQGNRRVPHARRADAERSNTLHGDRSKALSRRPTMAQGDWAGYQYDRIRKRVADDGVKVCYNHLMDMIVQSESDIDAFMANTKAFSAKTPNLASTPCGGTA